ncbi:MAG: hypothetical protein QM783_13365 [Phycisphaerales bacterium]
MNRKEHGPYSEYFGIDHAWPALDAKGFVGLFTTAGWGAIPSIVQQHPLMLEIEERAAALPVGGLRWLHPMSAKAPSVIGLARRGLYVYDWGSSVSDSVYQRDAIPALALHARDLSSALAACIPPGLQLNVSFAEMDEIDVCKHFDCLMPRRTP